MLLPFAVVLRITRRTRKTTLDEIKRHQDVGVQIKSYRRPLHAPVVCGPQATSGTSLHCTLAPKNRFWFTLNDPDGVRRSQTESDGVRRRQTDVHVEPPLNGDWWCSNDAPGPGYPTGDSVVPQSTSPGLAHTQYPKSSFLTSLDTCNCRQIRRC